MCPKPGITMFVAVSEGEVTDLRILSQQMERELLDLKQKNRELTEKTQTASSLETKVRLKKKICVAKRKGIFIFI